MKPAPQRTCVACRRTRPKHELVRLVKGAGEVEVDAPGRKPGRGAYLCPAWACWEKALKGGTLEKALRGTLTRQDREKLMAEGQKLLKELD